MPPFNSMWKSFVNSWRHHAGVQAATLTVLTATFMVFVVVLALSLNLRRIIVHWGENVQMTAYLREGLPQSRIDEISSSIEETGHFATMRFVSKEEAKHSLAEQMASFAPDLLQDPEFDSAVPSSFQMSVGAGDVVARLKEAAFVIGKIDGVEDVSYGQDWIENYGALVKGSVRAGWIIAFVLFAGSFLVIGNSIRAAVAQRRDEIEIMELVGATSSMIRAPFVFEGIMMGAGAAALAIWFGYIVHYWMLELLGGDLAFLNLGGQFQYLGFPVAVLLIVAGGAAGGIGSYVSVRRLNDGWAALEAGKF